ncbi:MAG: MerR family transcriptional regulator [Gammaproteobacteria bacterium]|nr:MerR family transcriptional regulator [Gammaproteobacteria bacterium]
MDEKANRRRRTGKVYYQISEVAQLTGVNESTLRNWEEQYEELRNVRRINNRRHYTAADIASIERIREKRSIKNNKDEEVAAESAIANPAKSVTKIPPVPSRDTLTSKQMRELVKTLREVKKELQDISSQLD